MRNLCDHNEKYQWKCWDLFGEASHLMTPMYKQNSNCLISVHAEHSFPRSLVHLLTHSLIFLSWVATLLLSPHKNSFFFLFNAHCTTDFCVEKHTEKSFSFYNERISNICYSSLSLFHSFYPKNNQASFWTWPTEKSRVFYVVEILICTVCVPHSYHDKLHKNNCKLTEVTYQMYQNDVDDGGGSGSCGADDGYVGCDANEG